jgi:hypothetical protein
VISSRTRCWRWGSLGGGKGGLAEAAEQAEERERAAEEAIQDSVARESGLGPLTPSQRKLRR